MTVRIFVGNHEEVKELAEEYPQEASVIEEMLEAADEDSDADSDEESESPDNS
ncbi:MAG: hypothetical protein HKP12_16165 [Gammaproteobacteria bacterium]|nr:hypothetical protein [Gammaproteobacteria bacterium]